MELNNKSLFREKCFVNGLWADSQKGNTIEVNNPATMQIIGKVPNFSAEETKSVIDNADKAFQSWKNTTAKERSIILKKWSDLIIENVDDLAKIMTIEQGKPLAEAKGEILMGASYIEFYAEEAKRVYGDIIPDPRPGKRIVIIKQPVGVVGAITPWNFPNSMITRKCAAALAVGCTTVVKPASQTPFSALAVAELAKVAGFPDGVFNIITGSAKEIGMELTKNPKVKKISFTGSTEVGKILMEQSASTVKKISMELGGHAPFIVFEDADIDEAVAGALQSKFRNSGQTCICTNRIFAHKTVYDTFLEKFTKEVKKIKVGNGLEEGIVSGPLIDKSSLEKVIDHVKDAVNVGAKIAVGGDVHPLGGNFYQPTVLSNVSTKAKITFEETFGPVAPVYKFSNDDEVIRMANDTHMDLPLFYSGKRKNLESC
ncbi:MAG: glutarate-semialdehyde dehydrogenase DavD [Pelagibacteraceae bacterium]|nr:MAG: glutarate-semialdehyde dehydrogenase DavD [Pelagibacteraceae bacterium]